MQIVNRLQLILGAVFLYLLQVHVLNVAGMNDYVKYVSPFFILVISLIVFRVYNRSISNYSFQERKLNISYGLLGAFIGFLSIGLCYEELRLLFKVYPEPVKYSDVIPQLEALYDRFANGEFPYYPLSLSTHAPFPVYLPINWLPIGLARYFHVDSRWIGILFLAIAIAVYAWYIFKRDTNIGLKVLLVFLPSMALWAAIIPQTIGLPVTIETLIAAYYLVLAVGLASKNLPLTIIGLILCLLSRYTLVFWLPMFAYLLWFNLPKKTSFITWGIVGLAIVVTLSPFFLEHPQSFLDGVKYHNNCAIAEMKGYGNPPVSWSHESGIYFAPHFKYLFSGDASTKVTILRGIQASVMILLNIIGILGYRKLKGKVNFYKYALGFLYLFMLYFYMLSPLTYAYYYLPVLMISALLMAEVCIIVFNKRVNTNN